MSTGLEGIVQMVAKTYILVRCKNTLKYRFYTSKRFQRGDRVWLYFKNGRTLVNVERTQDADPEAPPVKVEEPNHFHCDLGDVDCGE